MITVEVDTRQFETYLKKLGAQASREIGRALNSIGEDIRNTAITKIKDTGGRSGNLRLFIGQGKSAYYAKEAPKNSKYSWAAAIRASAKGEYPAANTGFLANNIILNQPNDLEVNVVSQAEYSAALEKNRPFMQMSIDANDKNITKHLDKALERLASL